MKHFLLKFNHGVEIGAFNAYIGHARRTGNPKIFSIARDELYHREGLKFMLNELGDSPSKVIDFAFLAIGKTIGFCCKFFPLWSLNLVARTMELFAIFNYEKLALKYPQYSDSFLKMVENERDHEEYFKS